jgi:cytoskeletal protein RodZ
LKKAREKRGITLDDVALTTKIGTRFLRAMEEELFEQLPGGIFNKGFIRAYARCVGLDEDQTIADFLIASGEVQPKKVEVTEPIQTPVPKPAVPKVAKPQEVLADKVEQPQENGYGLSFWAVSVGLVVLVVIASLGIWHFWSQRSSGPPETSAAATAPQASPPVPQNASVTPAGAGSTTTAPVPGAFTVLIKAGEESWMSLKADDKPMLEVTLEAGEQQSIDAHNKVEIKVGNLAGVDFWFNGKKVALQGEEGEVRVLTFDTNGLGRDAQKRPPRRLLR